MSIFRTRSALLELRQQPDGQVTVDMGAPRFEPAAIPLAAPARADHYDALLADGSTVRFGAAGMGNPHAVIRVDDVDRAEVAHIGPLLQQHPLWPESVNVGFIQIIDRRHARLRVYERGSGETLACGSGACAAFAVARAWGLLDARAELALPGGTLILEWDGDAQHPVLMTGRQACERLAERGVLAKDTHGSTIRLAPPLVVTEEDLDHALAQLAAVLEG